MIYTVLICLGLFILHPAVIARYFERPELSRVLDLYWEISMNTQVFTTIVVTLYVCEYMYNHLSVLQIYLDYMYNCCACHNILDVSKLQNHR